MYLINFSENISRLRREKKITQEQLADFVGVTKASVSKWETGQRIPDVMILPQLANFFDVTIDEILGYQPQLSNEQMKKIYLDLCSEFATNEFENVMEKSSNLVKKYYSCYPFLYRLSLLWINHYMLTMDLERQKEILTDALNLCIRIIENSKDIALCNDAVHLKATIKLLLGDAQDVIDSLEEIMNPCRIGSQSAGILIKAYQMVNKLDKANEYTQITMYTKIIEIVGCAVEYITIHSNDLSVCEETIRRVEMIANAYDLGHLNPSTLSTFYFQTAIVYCMQGMKEKSLLYLEKFLNCIEEFFKDGNVGLRSDEYFNKLDVWFEQLELGGNVPRDKKVILESAIQGLNHPVFAILEDEPKYQKMKKRLIV